MGIFTRTRRATMAAEADRGHPGEAGRSPARHTVTGHQPAAAGPPGPAPAARGPQRRQAGVGRRYAVVMLAAAATIGIASFLHTGGRIPLGFTTITGEHFSRVSVPEAIIAAVLAAGAVAVIVAPRRARAAALGALGFAVLGVLGGLGVTLTSSAGVLPVTVAGGRPHLAADLAYHLSVLVVLLAALQALARPRFRAKRAGLGSLPPGASSRGKLDMTTAGSPGPALGRGPGRGRTGPVGRFVARRARLVLVAALLAVVGFGVLGLGAFGKLQTGGFSDPGAQSTTAQTLTDQRFGGSVGVVLLVHAEAGTVDGAPARAAGAAAARRLAAVPGVSNVVSYWQTRNPGLRSKDGRYALILGTTKSGRDLSSSELAGLRSHTRQVDVTVGGSAAISNDILGQVTTSLRSAEKIAVPVILALLVFAFGSVVAALLPLAIGGIAILGTFAVLDMLGSVTNVSIYAINLTTALGLALAIDAALLMVSRFREELAAGREPPEAVARSVQTAGRTIVFSGATVAAALAVLLIFPMYFLRSFAYAGIGVVLITMAAAVVVLPALLAVLGRRVNSGRLPWARNREPSTAAPRWGRLARQVMRRPALIAIPVLAVLLLVALPLRHVQLGTPDDRVLPATTQSRAVGDVLRTDFTGNSATALNVITDGPLDRAALTAYAARLSGLAGVARVETSVATFVHGTAVPDSADPALARPTAQRLSVVSTADPRSNAAKDLVRTVRNLPGPGGAGVYVGGQTAELIDTTHAIGTRLPLAGLLIVLTTFIVLFLFTGSVVQPIRALMLNGITLAATAGLLVWIFQEGHLSGPLHFTALPLDTSMLVLLFCIAFGLSMDYEVIVLSRIKELHDQGRDNTTAVTEGLTRSGRIVTTAAALIAVTFFANATATVSFLQLFGIGAGFAVIIDATLVRAVLVPACQRLLGRAAWYAPPPLRRLNTRIGLGETSS